MKYVTLTATILSIAAVSFKTRELTPVQLYEPLAMPRYLPDLETQSLFDAKCTRCHLTQERMDLGRSWERTDADKLLIWRRITSTHEHCPPGVWLNRDDTSKFDKWCKPCK